jgi:tRNA threonylcarbamoyladenosine biosynthesis protein TsaE
VQVTLTSHSPNETTVLAAKLAPLLVKGDVLLLSGDVGAGKTDLVRKIIQNRMELCAAVEDVPSPTFTLVQTYELGAIEYIHADLYRISHPDEVYEIGLERGFDHAVCFVEWPDRLGSVAPTNALSINISIIDDDIRHFKFSWTHPRWSDRLGVLDALDLGGRH